MIKFEFIRDGHMKLEYNDGGREKAGWKGDAGDCVVRSIAIATEQNYQTVYEELSKLSKSERPHTRSGKRSSARNGVFRRTYERYLATLGWKWVPTMKFGQGCRVHLKEDELPKGRLIVAVSKHLTAVIDGVVHDTHNPSRSGTRCVYGYYVKEGV